MCYVILRKKKMRRISMIHTGRDLFQTLEISLAFAIVIVLNAFLENKIVNQVLERRHFFVIH